MSDEVAWLDATAQAELVRSNQVSPAELVGEAIRRIETLNPELNAVIHELYDRLVPRRRASCPTAPSAACHSS